MAITVGSVTVDVVPDVTKFNRRMAEIARNVSIAVKVDADTRAAEARIAALDGGEVTVRANLDDEEARARLDELTHDREVNVNVNADTAGAEANVARLGASASGAGTGLGAMATAALTLGPALIPLGAAALGATAGFASLGLAGVAGVGVLTIGLSQATNAVKLMTQAQTQHGAALAKTNAEIAQLNPATRSFGQFAMSTLIPAWHGLQNTVASGLFPGLQAGIQSMMPDLPLLTTFLHNVSTAMGDLFQSAGKALTDPFWTNFFRTLNQNVGPALTALAQILGNIIKGFAGLFEAFLPIGNVVIGGMVSLSQRFADFGANAGSNSGFQKVIEYIKANLPAVGHLIGGLVTAIGHIVEALAPLGPPILAGLNGLVGVLNRLPIGFLTQVAVIVASIVAGIKLWGVVMAVVNAITDANPIVLVLGVLAAGLLLAYNSSKTFRDFIATQVLPTLKEWGQWIADHIVPALHDLWDFIANHLVPVLAGIFMHVWQGIVDVVHAVSDAISGHRAELKQLWDLVSGFVGWVVRDVLPLLGPVLQGAFWLLGHAISVVIDIVSGLIDMWNAMWQLGKDLGAWFAGPFVGFFVGVWDHIRAGWQTLVNDIKGLWQDIEHWVMDPVAWVVKFVINDGLIAAWDWISDHLLGGALHATPMGVPTVPPLAASTGLVVPGYAPGVDSVHAVLSPGEGVLVPEAVRGLGGPGAIHAINSQFSSRVPSSGDGHFSGGGIVDSIIGALVPGAGIAEAIGGQKMTAIIDDPLHAIQNLVKTVMGGIGKAGPFIDMLGQAMLGMAKGVGGALLQAIQGSGFAGLTGLSSRTNLGNLGNIGALGSGAFSGSLISQLAGMSLPGASGAAQWRTVVDQVLAALGLPISVDSGVLNIIQHESGGNPNAINLTDSNAAAGHPSQGLMQTIPSTFYAYAGPYASLGITNPFANIYAGVNYAAHRYGVGMLAAGGRSSGGRYIGYDAGGLLAPGPSLVYNGTGQPELIAPQRTFEQVMSGASGGAAGATYNTHVYAANDPQSVARVVDQQQRLSEWLHNG